MRKVIMDEKNMRQKAHTAPGAPLNLTNIAAQDTEKTAIASITYIFLGLPFAPMRFTRLNRFTL